MLPPPNGLPPIPHHLTNGLPLTPTRYQMVCLLSPPDTKWFAFYPHQIPNGLPLTPTRYQMVCLLSPSYTRWFASYHILHICMIWEPGEWRRTSQWNLHTSAHLWTSLSLPTLDAWKAWEHSNIVKHVQCAFKIVKNKSYWMHTFETVEFFREFLSLANHLSILWNHLIIFVLTYLAWILPSSTQFYLSPLTFWYIWRVFKSFD